MIKDIHIRLDEATVNRIDDLLKLEQKQLNTNSRKDVSIGSVVRNGIRNYWDNSINSQERR